MSAMQNSRADWSSSISEAASRFGTPCYLFSWPIVLEALDVLTSLECGVPIRHWLSMKTQPLRYLLREWRELGLGVEVVSEFELRAALEQGFPPDRILVNGVAKHYWLSDIHVQGLRVHFDSLQEASAPPASPRVANGVSESVLRLKNNSILMNQGLVPNLECPILRHAPQSQP
jgi:diaminopimelate decarboxylase